jgi:competence protein ComEA
MWRWLGVGALVTALIWSIAAGCSGDSAEREKKIHETAAKAAEAAKPPLQEAGRDIKAAVEGAKEGWEKDEKKTLDLNSATEEDLTGLPGIGKHEAKKIMSGRPYHDPHELVTKKILGEAAYAKIKDDVSAD